MCVFTPSEEPRPNPSKPRSFVWQLALLVRLVEGHGWDGSAWERVSFSRPSVGQGGLGHGGTDRHGPRSACCPPWDYNFQRSDDPLPPRWGGSSSAEIGGGLAGGLSGWREQVYGRGDPENGASLPKHG